MLRRFLFEAGWRLAWPLRAYLRHTPPNRARPFLEALLVRALFPLAPATFVASLPGGGTIVLRYREQIGLSTLLNGPFEAAEAEALCRLARPGTTAIDAGANIGLFTIPLARSVGATGHVLAFEPTEETVRRLRDNLRRNGVENVTVVEAALGRASGRATLCEVPDGAYNSTASGVGGRRIVRVHPLDDVWEQQGRPEISAIKVDVEGSELDVLAGATLILGSSRPAVLVEAAQAESERAVADLLAQHDYVRSATAAFQPWNHLFLPAEASSTRMAVSAGRVDA